MQRPHERQILVNIGNRFVVFGSGVSFPNHRQLGPADVKRILPRVGNERDGIEERLVDSVVIDGAEVLIGASDEFGDFQIRDQHGDSILIEVKVGDRDFAGLDLGQAWAELSEAAGSSERREIWGFNLERLGLGIVWSEGPMAPGFVQLSPLNVWEFNEDGSTFQRQQLLDRLQDWEHRIHALYSDVEMWALEDGLTISRNRTVPMSEELMQKFAVADRDMPILDIGVGSEPVASFVPVGLWLIGFNGQISVITQTGTSKLGDRADFPDPAKWTLIDPKDRSSKIWNRDEYRSLLGLVSADE